MHTHGQHAPRPHPEPSPHDHAHHEEFRAHLRAEHAAKVQQTIRIGIASIAGFVLITGVGVFFWLRHLDAEQAAHAATVAGRASLRTELLAPVPADAAAARAALARIEARRADWLHGPDHDAIARHETAVREAIATFALHERAAAELSAVQAIVDQAGTGTAWRPLHDRLWALDATVDPTRDAAQHAQLVTLIERVDTAWFDALATTSSSDANATLAALTDGIELGTFHHDDPHGHHDRTLEQAWRQRLHNLVPRFDTAQRAVFGPDAVAAATSQVLLPGSSEADWVASRGARLVRTLRDGVLTVRSDGSDGSHSDVLTLVRPLWYGATVRVTVQLERGEVVLFGRARRQFDPRHGGGLTLATTARTGAVVVPAGQPVPVELLLLGDRLQAKVGDRTVDQQLHHDERCGGFGLLVRPGTELSLRELKVQRLGAEPAPFARRGRG